MELLYSGKLDKNKILNRSSEASLKKMSGSSKAGNLLVKGDNLMVMRTLLNGFNLKEKADLVYIDPPFSTNTIYRRGKNRTATISSSKQDEFAYSDKLLGAEYIEFLRERLYLLKELMSERASIYVHIDYKIGHYLKVIMDEVFGNKNFRNDITRIKCNPKNFKRSGYSNIKDMVLFYTKTKNFIWNEPLVNRSAEEIKRLFNKTDKQGRRYTTNPLHAPGETKNGRTGREWKGILPPTGRHWRYDPKVLDELDRKGLVKWSRRGVPRKIIYADDYDKKRLQDIWEFKDTQKQVYPTEKNIDLLRNIIRTSSSENSLVLDCFCGSGTTLIAAAELQRKWIGIDNSKAAIDATKMRLGKNTPLLSSYIYYE